MLNERGTYTRLARAFKQINPVGELGPKTLAQATKTINGDDAGGPSWLTFIEGDAGHVAEIKQVLNDAVFGVS